MSTRFYFGGSDSESGGEEDALPYPQPLARSAFLAADFAPTTFLSSLSNRHQTLEDLRGELRARSQELHRELLDLVNDNYQDFLGLGSSLAGGDERVEEVRVGLLSFRREIEGLKTKVTARRDEVEGLLREKKVVAERIRKARALLEIDTRLEELEHALAITVTQNGHAASEEDDEEYISISESEDSDDDDAEGEYGGGTFPVAKLRQRVQQFVAVKRLMGRLDPTHPYLVGQADRIEKIRETLLIDLSGALTESKRTGNAAAGPLKVLALYRTLDEPQAAVRALKELDK